MKFSGLRQFGGEIAESALGRWAYLAFVLGGPLVWLADWLTLSVRRYLAVVWVYGSAGYEHAGIRYVGGRPPKFNDGSGVPVEAQVLASIVPSLLLGVLGAVCIAFALSRVFARSPRHLTTRSSEQAGR